MIDCKSLRILGLPLLCIVLTCVACQKEEMNYDVPASYHFKHVSYDGQLQRLSMLLEMKEYMAGSYSGESIDAQRLSDMFSNENGAEFEGEYTKELRAKTYSSAIPMFEDLFNTLAIASQSDHPGSEGQAGVVTSSDGESSYLLSSNGLDIPQLVEKGLMGACFMHQALQVYLSDDKMNVDNEQVETGKGTAMQHHWDEAFGYLGVPRDFPTNSEDAYFWGKYLLEADVHFNCAQPLMDAFLRGRAAIGQNDYDTRDEQIEEIRRIWERVCAAQAVHYLNVGIAQIDDDALRSHALSEGLGFVFSLRFSDLNTVSYVRIEDWLSRMGGTGSSIFDEMNLYECEEGDLMEVRDEIAESFDLDDVKNEL